MNILYLFDATSYAIMAPTMLLFSLMCAAAQKERCFPWPAGGALNKTQARAPNRPMSAKRAVSAQVVIFLAWLASSICILHWGLAHLFGTCVSLSEHWPITALIPKLLYELISFISLLLTLPIFWFLQLRLFQKSSAKCVKAIVSSSEFILAVALVTWAVVVSLPIVQFLLITAGLSKESVFIMRDLFRVSIAISTIPSSVGALAIVFRGIRNTKEASKVLEGRNLSPSALNDKTDDELHRLIELALKLKNVAAADKISRHLLERVDAR
jgi:hypothetical protein